MLSVLVLSTRTSDSVIMTTVMMGHNGAITCIDNLFSLIFVSCIEDNTFSFKGGRSVKFSNLSCILQVNFTVISILPHIYFVQIEDPL